MFPFSRSMYPHEIRVRPQVVTSDVDGGQVMTPNTGLVMKADVQPGAGTPVNAARGFEHEAVVGVVAWTVFTAEDPGVLPDDLIEWAGRFLLVQGPARPVAVDDEGADIEWGTDCQERR